MFVSVAFGRRAVLKRRHLQEIDLGEEYQLVFELRPAHDPTKAYGFAGVVLCLKDLSSSVFLWHRDGDRWAITKVISIPAEPAEPDQLPPMLKGFKACPPFVTDIDLSVDDKYLYVSCWGAGDFHQYDVSDPFSRNLRGNYVLVALSHALRIRRVVSRLMADPRW
jgi:methanethiol oxidase